MLFAHYVLDYPLQGEFLAQTKGKHWYSLLAHSIIYGLGISVLFYFIYKPTMLYMIPTAFWLVGSHAYIDACKSTAKNKNKALTSYLYIDQGLHILINIIVMLVLKGV